MGLKALKKQLDEQAAVRADREANGGFKKATRDYELLKSGSVKFRLMQELDEDAKNYDESRGLGAIYAIHQTAFNVKPFRAARCTKETLGQCYGCERYADRSDEDSKDWRPRTMVYVNALAEVDGEYVPFVFGQKDRSALVEFLLEWSAENDTITDVVLKLTKSGAGKDTKYSVIPLRTDPATFKIEDYEVFPVDQAIANIEYDKQAAFYGGGATSSSDSEDSTTAKPATSSDEDW